MCAIVAVTVVRSPFMLFVCERNLMIVPRAAAAAATNERVPGESLCVRGREARGLIGGPPEWAAGEPLAGRAHAHTHRRTGIGKRKTGNGEENVSDD